MRKGLIRVGLISITAIILMCTVGVYDSQAAETKSSIQKKITTTKKDITKLKKQKSDAVKKENKAKKGTKYISGEVLCSNPLIIKQNDLFSYSYYWVTNAKEMDNLLFYAMGYIVPTGKYRTYNGITCVEGKAKRIKITSTSIQKKIDSKNKQLKIYQNSLKEKVVIKNQVFAVGAKKKVKYSWTYGGKYNSIKWTSSNKTVATIDKTGKIVAKKTGKTTITAKSTLSGKSTKCTITVTNKIKDLEFEEYFYNIYTGQLPDSQKTTLKLKYSPSNSLENITVTSSNTDVAEIVSYKKGIVTIKFNGSLDETTISAKTSSGVTTSCTVYFFDELAEDIYFEDDVFNVYEDELTEDSDVLLQVYVKDMYGYVDEPFNIFISDNEGGTILEYAPTEWDEICLLLGKYGTAKITVETTYSKLRASCIVNYQKTRGTESDDDYYYDDYYDDYY